MWFAVDRIQLSIHHSLQFLEQTMNTHARVLNKPNLKSTLETKNLDYELPNF